MVSSPVAGGTDRQDDIKKLGEQRGDFTEKVYKKWKSEREDEVFCFVFGILTLRDIEHRGFRRATKGRGHNVYCSSGKNESGEEGGHETQGQRR